MAVDPAVFSVRLAGPVMAKIQFFPVLLGPDNFVPFDVLFYLASWMSLSDCSLWRPLLNEKPAILGFVVYGFPHFQNTQGRIGFTGESSVAFFPEGNWYPPKLGPNFFLRQFMGRFEPHTCSVSI